MFHGVMKVFPVTRWLAALSLGLVVAGELPAQGEVKEWPVTQIRLSRWDIGWELTVNRNGSGSAVYGSTGGDVASFPKGTVDFKRLVDAATTRKTADPNDPKRVSVSILGGGRPDEWNVAKSRDMDADWLELCRQIQPHLQTSNLERVNSLLKRNPLAEGLPYVPATMPPTSVPQPRRIRVSHAGAPWNIVIGKDGGGSVAHEATHGAVAWFPKGTLDYGAMVEQAKHRKTMAAEDAAGVTISVDQSSGSSIESTDTVADWEALCRKIQPHLQSAKPELLNQLLKEHPLAGSLPEIPVRPLETVSQTPAPAIPADE